MSMSSSPKYPSFVIYEGYDRTLALQSVGPGWASIIHELFDSMESKKISLKIIQVKEKWGGLRIYTDFYNEEIEKFIQELCQKSYTICEICGAPGKLRTGGWHRTLCDTHGDNRPVVENTGV